MYDRHSKPIEQIVILLVMEDEDRVACYKKDKKDYEESWAIYTRLL